MLDKPRSMLVSHDIDGLVSAAMLGSVAPDFEIVAFVIQSRNWLVHPSVRARIPDDAIGVDIFSTQFDNISNHVVKWGTRKITIPEVFEAFQEWDLAIDVAAQARLFAVPSIWANTQGGYEQVGRADSANYKYPLGTAQLLLALLEASGHPPKFYDRTYLPWLVANCDGGVSSFTKYPENVGVWWPVLAGAVGPASLTEQIFRLVESMRPHEFLDAVRRLDRERQARQLPAWLDDSWNLANESLSTLTQTLQWITELTGWRDPVRGGIKSLKEWELVPAIEMAQVYHGATMKPPKSGIPPWMVKARDNPQDAASKIRAAIRASNANFYMGGQSGSRFNWIGSW